MKSKINVVKINNPFDYSNREVYELDYSDEKALIEYLPKEADIVCSVNGKKIGKDEYRSLKLRPSDSLVIIPAIHGGGNGILGTLLSIAVMVVAFYAAPAIAGLFGPATTGVAGATGMAAWTTSTYIAFGAIMAIGGALVSGLMPNPSTDYSTSSTDPTYGWSIQSSTGQGSPIQVTFGTVKTGGQILSQHVTTDGSNNYLNILLSGGEGPLDEITDLKIADNPLDNYENVVVDYRYGVNDQEVIQNFADSYSDQSLNYELTVGDWRTQQTEGNGGKGLEIVISFPNGLYYTNDSGSLEAAYVTITAEYRIVGESTWTTWNTWAISDSTNSSLLKTYRVDNLDAGKYEVRVKCLSKSGTSVRYSTRAYWIQLSHIVYDDFCYPNTALIGVKALATSQLSGGSPAITWIQSRNTVRVFNPITNQYDNMPADNPAWAAYDIIHYCRRLKNINSSGWQDHVFGFPSSRIRYADFKRWADFCDSKNIKFNHIFDSVNDFWGTLSVIEVIGRGKVHLKGTTYCCTYDDATEPVCMFSMGNIIQGSFREEYLPIKDRANCIEITFFDKEQDYNRNQIMIYGSSYDSDEGIANPAQITLYGCDNLEQAYRDGMYRLRCNESQIHTVFFNADIDAIGCQVGDVFNFQHDVLLIGQGGRLEDAKNGMVTLDTDVTMTPENDYQITIALFDGSVVTCSVKKVTETTYTNKINLNSTKTWGELSEEWESWKLGGNSSTEVWEVESFIVIPKRYDTYSFGQVGNVVKPFRMIGLTRSGELKRQITGIEYVESIYNESDDVPTIEYPASVFNISNLSLSQGLDGNGNISILMSWIPPRGSYNGAIIKVNGMKVGETDYTTTSFSHSIQEIKTYTVSVIGLDGFNNPAGTLTSTITILNSVPDVVSYTVSQNLRNLEHSWILPGGVTNKIEIRKLATSTSSWNSGQVILTNFSGTKFVDTSISTGVQYYAIKCIGQNGAYSNNQKVATVNVDYIPSANIVVAKDLFPPDGTYYQCTYVNDLITPDVGLSWNQLKNIWVTWQLGGNTGSEIWGRTWQSFSNEHNNVWEIKGLWGGGAVPVAYYTSAEYSLSKELTCLVQPKYGIIIDDDSTGCSIEVQWRYSSDGIEWTDWEVFSYGAYKFKHHQWKIFMLSENGYSISLSSFEVMIDVPDVFLKFIGVEITNAETGVRIDFTPNYITDPSATATLVDGQAGYCSVLDRDETGMSIIAYDSSGQKITGILDAQVWGY